MAGKGTATAYLLLPHCLKSFEIQKSRKNGSKFNGAYSRKNLPKIKDAGHVINLDEFKSIDNNIIYFDSIGVKHIPKEIKKFIRKKT